MTAVTETERREGSSAWRQANERRETAPIEVEARAVVAAARTIPPAIIRRRMAA
jgi:hypothetical protein